MKQEGVQVYCGDIAAKLKVQVDVVIVMIAVEMWIGYSDGDIVIIVEERWVGL